MPRPLYPSLYQINTRVWLTRLSQGLGRAVTLDDVPDAELDRLAAMGFDWVWLLSVWQTGQAGRCVSRANPEWRREFQETLPDLREEDIAGSGFAITAYTVHDQLGGDAALDRRRQPVVREGQWQALECLPAWEGNWTWDCLVAFAWQSRDGERLLVTVNQAANQSQCYVRLPFADLGGGEWRLQDQLGEVVHDRDGSDLQSRGLYLDVPPWQASVFALTRRRWGPSS